MGHPSTIKGWIACLKLGRVPGSSLLALWLVALVMGAQHASLNLKWKLGSCAYRNFGDDSKSAHILTHRPWWLLWRGIGWGRQLFRQAQHALGDDIGLYFVAASVNGCGLGV